MSYIAPAGTPITLQDIAAGFATGMRSRALDSLRTLLTQGSGTRSCWPVCSARAGMIVALRAMSRAAGPGRNQAGRNQGVRNQAVRNQVIVPGYTCYSVPAAIRRAGLQPIFCDVDPRTLSLDLGHLATFDFRNVLTIVSANLYGIPNDLTAIEATAKANGVFLLDDAAQALGAHQAGRAAGGFGDAGLYSFDKGKNIATIQGGAIVANVGPVAQALEAEWESLPDPRTSDTWSSAGKLFFYSLLLDPARYGLVRRLPGLGLGQTAYEERFPVTRYSALLAGVAVRLGSRLEAINGVRKTNGQRLRSALENLPGITLIELPPGADPVYLRFPIRVTSQRMRAALLSAFELDGIGATSSYPKALADVPEIAAYASAPGSLAGARNIANTILTLPTHAYCPEDLPARVRRIVEGCKPD